MKAYCVSSLLVALLLASGCSKKLTNDRAQRAIMQWDIQASPWICNCNGPCIGSGGSPISVAGVQEIPQENTARAALVFREAPFNHSCPNERKYSGPGEAVFNRYTDGRWVLVKISTSEGFNSISFDNLNVEVR